MATISIAAPTQQRRTAQRRPAQRRPLAPSVRLAARPATPSVGSAVRAAAAPARPAARPTTTPVRAAARPTTTPVRLAPRQAARVATGSTSATAGRGVRPTLVLERPRATSGARPLRLTRRGRRVARTLVVLLALGTALVLSVAGHSATSQAGDSAAVPATTTVVVQPGQTLWSVARGLSADADLRETVARIQELNGLSGTASNTVRPGQQLVVPVVR